MLLIIDFAGENSDVCWMSSFPVDAIGDPSSSPCTGASAWKVGGESSAVGSTGATLGVDSSLGELR